MIGGKGRVSTSTSRTSQSSHFTPTIPRMSQAIGVYDQPFILVLNPNYMAPSAAPPPPRGSCPTTSLVWTPQPPPSAQQPTTSMAMTPPAIDIAVPDLSHGSQPDLPLPPPVVWMMIWPDGLTGCVLF
ncbi:uncharacterized protein DS421_20g687980 [Arachis hypogaea]|nr:uncharacterized protein DS421_20g687980 [Arachis hypogaea]